MEQLVRSSIVALCLASIGAHAQTQIITLRSGNLPVATNQIISLIGYCWPNHPVVTAAFPDGTSAVISVAQSSLYPTPQIVTGATNVITSASFVTLQIETPGSMTVSNYVPADAIVIPASSTGSVQVILESSQDLLNWTGALPGTYGANAGTNRFFRVRAVTN